MTTTQSNLAALSRFLFRAPDWYSSVTFALVLAAVTGIGAFDSQFILEDAYRGIFYVGIPTLVASFLTPHIDQRLGGKLNYNRSSLLAVTCEVIVVILLTAGGVIAVLTPLGQEFVLDILLGALAFIFAFRLAIIMSVSTRNPLIAAIPASLQTGVAAILLFIYSGTLRFFEVGGPLLEAYLSRSEKAPAELLVVVPQDFLLLVIMSIIYSMGVLGLIYFLDRPWRRGLGVSGFDLLRGFMGHIAEGSRDLEEFFERIGERAIIPVSVLSFRHLNGTEKARFVLPMVHPGPMGEIGGGNLPERIATETEGLAFPPHATAGHDFNLVTENEVDVLLRAVSRAYDKIEYQETASHAKRFTIDQVSVLGQCFNDDALLIATFSPGAADDVDFGVGLSAMAEARSSGVDDVMLVDAHNCNDGVDDGPLGHVTPGSKRSFDLFQAAGQVSEQLVDAPQDPIEMGTAWDRTPWQAGDGIGPLGIRVAVVRVNNQDTAYILIDGNNMEIGLRDRIVSEIRGIDELEIMTTDTHIVNTIESTNQVGESIDHDTLITLIQNLITTALNDLEPVSVGMASEQAEVIIFGNDRTETLASHANAVVSIGWALAGALVLATVSISILIFFFAAS